MISASEILCVYIYLIYLLSLAYFLYISTGSALVSYQIIYLSRITKNVIVWTCNIAVSNFVPDCINTL